LRAGDLLPTGDVSVAGTLAHDREAVSDPAAPVELPIRPGPRDDWFAAGALEALCGATYRMGTQSNRVGARLTGAAIVRSRRGELPSEGLVLGAVQITPDGSPIVFLADHPTTGGYPVIGVVDALGVNALAQVRPGAPVIFRQV
jgi:allophanate hydrolase subunit 2